MHTHFSSSVSFHITFFLSQTHLSPTFLSEQFSALHVTSMLFEVPRILYFKSARQMSNPCKDSTWDSMDYFVTKWNCQNTARKKEFWYLKQGSRSGWLSDAVVVAVLTRSCASPIYTLAFLKSLFYISGNIISKGLNQQPGILQDFESTTCNQCCKHVPFVRFKDLQRVAIFCEALFHLGVQVGILSFLHKITLCCWHLKSRPVLPILHNRLTKDAKYSWSALFYK